MSAAPHPRATLPARAGAPDVAVARAAVVRVRRLREARLVAVTLTLAGLCFLVLCVSLSLGEIHIPLPDVVQSLFGGSDRRSRYIVTNLRLPRALTGVLAGLALGLAGAIFQTLVRNPLATPDMIGITAGASAAAVAGIVLFDLAGYALSVAALIGALATALLIYALAWRRGVTGYRLVLVGIAMNALLTSVVSYLLTMTDIYDARQAFAWLVGSLTSSSWDTARTLGLCLAVLVPAALFAGRRLPVLQAGDEVARALGVPVERARAQLVVLAVALAAVATAAVGPVGFVAFVAAPIARQLLPGEPAVLVPSALVGALVMTTADLAGQHAVPSMSYPVGVVTAVVGAPYLLWLLAVSNRSGRGG
ncbi:FecCD family ABC transporter permease [Frankia nepalensis]|uniref:Iron chelate uptake ABC transporter family permease subunit n=1 Tax=Frankia nepalensis TaxID=1836974 RepID=A0A937RLH4_9ACTN|nr:iron chelate uptake ABC transporter family permease subunit [Frankia nepalensis]MBL7497617.1 iron chelate uptake ABC transporter family permease subunit [Frankia nepalensis]MBL7510945.1 iron chelate uptake ABC transporter family permease subunit [Frankia nepalensis]MBL7631090.1 iron chelate uptake ABC transporter family permease subunit [Frankia nepalensis]